MENPSLIKYGFWFLVKFPRHQKEFKCLVIVLKCFSQVYISIYNVKTSLLEFLVKIKEFLSIFLPVVSDPELADRPGRSTARSTVPRAGRPCSRPTCTELCTSAAQWAGRPDGQPELRAVLSVLFGRPGGRPAGACGQIRPLDGRLTGRPAVHFWQFLLPTAIIFWGL